jgi:hypothetical protein
MTTNKGRGVFASNNLMKGDLIVVDTAIVETTLENLKIKEKSDIVGYC